MKMLRLIMFGVVLFGMTICLAGTASAGVSPVYLNDGLLGYYSFDGNADDESGNGNDATANGAVLTTDRFGNPNSAYSFDGVDDYIISAAATPGLQVSDAFTLSVWINKADTSTERIAGLYQDLGAGLPEYAMLYSASKTRIMTRDADNLWYKINAYSSTVISANSWHHLVFTFDGPNYNFYLDGVSDGSGTKSTSIRDDDLSPYLYIGARGDGKVTEFFTGIIDDVAIYNRALSGDEVAALNALPTSVIAPEPVSMVLFLTGAATMGFIRLRKKK